MERNKDAVTKRGPEDMIVVIGGMTAEGINHNGKIEKGITPRERPRFIKKAVMESTPVITKEKTLTVHTKATTSQSAAR